MTIKLTLPVLLLSGLSFGQTPMAIPPAITNTSINLTLQTGVTQFYSGVNTNTMGANDALLGPTLIMNQGDNVSITVEGGIFPKVSGMSRHTAGNWCQNITGPFFCEASIANAKGITTVRSGFTFGLLNGRKEDTSL